MLNVELSKEQYDDLRNGTVVKVFINDVLIKSKYVYDLTPDHFLAQLIYKKENKKLEDSLCIKIKFGILEQEINVVGHFRVINSEGWK